MNDTKPRPMKPTRKFYMPPGFYAVLDMVLVFVAFGIAYYIRYELRDSLRLGDKKNSSGPHPRSNST